MFNRKIYIDLIHARGHLEDALKEKEKQIHIQLALGILAKMMKRLKEKRKGERTHE